jgi:hypothetical protein
MHKYSHYFHTLHDEQAPIGDLGRGTHCSILRAVVFHDAEGAPLIPGRLHDFAVIWDEDHDDRVIEPIQTIYQLGLLPAFIAFGERKGNFSAIVRDDTSPKRLSLLDDRVNSITQNLVGDDVWPAQVAVIGSPELSIISDRADKVALYLANLNMLWRLGPKQPAEKLEVLSDA